MNIIAIFWCLQILTNKCVLIKTTFSINLKFILIANCTCLHLFNQLIHINKASTYPNDFSSMKSIVRIHTSMFDSWILSRKYNRRCLRVKYVSFLECDAGREVCGVLESQLENLLNSLGHKATPPRSTRRLTSNTLKVSIIHFRREHTAHWQPRART